MSKKITFEESLGASDWGLIIDNNGRLKGLFIPEGSSEDDVPENIIQLCCPEQVPTQGQRGPCAHPRWVRSDLERQAGRPPA